MKMKSSTSEVPWSDATRNSLVSKSCVSQFSCNPPLRCIFSIIIFTNTRQSRFKTFASHSDYYCSLRRAWKVILKWVCGSNECYSQQPTYDGVVDVGLRPRTVRVALTYKCNAKIIIYDTFRYRHYYYRYYCTISTFIRALFVCKKLYTRFHSSL